jgi:4-hydroxybenzoate polyprenyltransferase
MPLRRNPGLIPSLVLAAHPLQALLIAAGTAFAALLSGRDWREVALVLVTVLLGRATYGWLNDVVDRERDIAVERQSKVLVREWLDRGTLTFATAVAVCFLVPLSIANGTMAGLFHLGSVLAAWLYDTRVKTTFLSFVPWALSFALLVPFLSYGGWGGGVHGEAPEWQMVALAAVLGVCVHVLDALPDLVEDHRNGVRSLPLRIALRTGAQPLLWITAVLTAATIGGIVWAGMTVGLQA